MKYLNEYRESKSVHSFVNALEKITTNPWKIMEVCGGQTHSIIKNGLDELLPKKIQLLHGPGCPVCVTPVEYIDKAIEISLQQKVIFCTFGDMLRVPGSREDLYSAKSKGAQIKVVYSPMDALEIAQKNPDADIVFFAVGFETTAPANAMAAYQAAQKNISNFSLLVSHVLVPPALESLLESPSNSIQGFLAAGHVCSVMGIHEYKPIAEKYKTPIVVTGFEPLDILQGIYLLIRQLEEGRYEVENQYERFVRPDGNREAQKMILEVFEVSSRFWRGLGEISQSGLKMREKYKHLDAETKYGPVLRTAKENENCWIGAVLRGEKKPTECPSFGKKCTPMNPLGATMVSSEGACAAYMRSKSHDH